MEVGLTPLSERARGREVLTPRGSSRLRYSSRLRPVIRFLWIFHIHCISPISGVRIAAPMILAQHKGNERMGKARTPVRCTSPIVVELAY
jgi:hypothetical protein